MKFFLTIVTICFLSCYAFSQKYEPDSVVAFTDKGCKLIDYYFEDSLTYLWSGECKSGWIEGDGLLIKIRKGKKYSTTSARFERGISQGKGIFKLHQTNERYEGIYVDGQIRGIGKYWNDNGDYYQGQIINFILHGNGKMTYANGSTFEGKFNVSKYWTGKFTNLKDEVSYLYRRTNVEKLPKGIEYSPKLGQELTEYFDAEWNRCSKKDAVYFRKVTYSAPNIPSGRVRDYYIDGTMQNEYLPLYIDYEDDQMTFHGKYKTVYYYKSGGPSSICFYDHQSRKSGYEYDFYESGELFSETIYGSLGLMDGPYREFYKDGSLKGYAKYSYGDRVNNAYWQISEKGNWIGVFLLNFAEEFEKFEMLNNCANVFEYSNMLCIKIPEKDCYYFNPSILEVDGENLFSLQLDLVLDEPDDERVFGVIFNYEDDKNFSVLKLSGNKLYAISSFRNGNESVDIPWTKLNIILDKGSLNYDVLLTFLKDEMVLEINDLEVNRIPFHRSSSMQCGLFARGKGLSVIRDFGEVVYFDEESSKGYSDFAIAEREGKSTETESDGFTGNGSGFLVSNDGYIATNYHVIEGANTIQVEFDFEEGREAYKAQVVQFDKENDVAIVKVDFGDKEIELPYQIASRLQDVGSEIFTLGYPYADVMGSEIKFTDGSINSRTGIQGDIRFYQISAPIQPGNSGGPCFNANGEVIGIVTQALNNDKYQNQNVNYVLKISYLENLMALLPERSMNYTPRAINNKSISNMVKYYKIYVPIILTK